MNTYETKNLFGEVVKRNLISPNRAIEEVVQENPQALKDNMVLLAGVWRKQGYDLPKDFETVAHKAETITRLMRSYKK